MKKFWKKSMSLCLASGILLGTLNLPAIAKTPAVTVDETAYVTMDYYGNVSESSIVKGCDLNGNTELIDYGDYASVINMTSLDKPQTDGNKTVFNLTETVPYNRFYYQVKPREEAMRFPWTFDVNYKLNGVPAKAEDLPGASGVVSVDVDAIPNESANSYFKENFILVVAMLSNREDNYSFTAPGAQFQSLASYQIAAYAVLPKDEDSLHFEIGSDSFESIGVLMAMVPATVSKLDFLADLKEDKQEIEDASQAISTGIDILLRSVNGMSGGFRETQSGLAKLDNARQTLYDSEDAINIRYGQLIKSMQALTNQLRRLGEHASDNADYLENIGDEFDDVVDALDQAQGSSIQVQKLLKRVQDMLEKLQTADPEQVQGIQAKLMELLITLNGGSDEVDVEALQKQMAELMDAINSLLGQIQDSGAAGQETVELMQLLSEMLKLLSSASNMISDTAGGSSRIINEISNMSDDLLDDGTMSTLSRTMYGTSGLLSSLQAFSDTAKEVLDGCKEQLNEGAVQVLNGTQNILANAANSTDQMENLQKQKESLANIIESKWTQLDEDYGILDIDVEAEKVSFTSPENTEPRSLQVILRTQEIALDDDEEKVVPTVNGTDSTNVTGRIKAVFEKIGKAVSGFFS
ncbi:hypothetical protein [Marasmitruncus massiliensis]|uniref:hypothetical protein n=1 Tax=Marasmitruncus massiliensis TaxID=1944642 RepID=UPI000C7D56A2|nr:hypothetical protein [Marasmitruncus massiliensis]